ncbi:MAG: hypothetical protein J2P48_02530 [Alphaproteobacteria bacterium]|nr:hypothetical protein [Alphaproteobacteria bacterium]
MPVHPLIFAPLLKPLLGNVNAEIVEEDFTSHGTGTVGLPLDTFREALLAKYPVLYTEKNTPRGKPDIERQRGCTSCSPKSTVSSPGWLTDSTIRGS